MEENNILSFFKQHPILVLTFSALLCSAVGYWSEYSLLREFGLNIVVFAEIDDFFLAGLKSPKIFLFAFPMFAIGIAYISIRVNRLSREQLYASREELEIERMIEKAQFDKEKEELAHLKSKQNEMKRYFKEKLSSERRKASLMVVPILLLSVISVFVLLQFELNKNLERIVNNPPTQATIKLRTGDIIPKQSEFPLVFITATEKFMFFYQHDADKQLSTVAVPIASIADVVYTSFKASSSSVSNKQIQPTPKNGAAD